VAGRRRWSSIWQAGGGGGSGLGARVSWKGGQSILAVGQGNGSTWRARDDDGGQSGDACGGRPEGRSGPEMEWSLRSSRAWRCSRR
jgi:hypothetical protein